jgi:acetoin utilization deacetylase AcuC-like enzyme
VNLPLEVGAVDEDYRLIFADVVVPILRQFRPDLVLVSAGFDAHERDPLGGMRLTTASFAAMTMDLREVAEECCGGRLVAVTEGGYDLHALGESIQAVTEALADDRVAPGVWPAPSAVSAVRGRAAVVAARASLGRFWKF